MDGLVPTKDFSEIIFPYPELSLINACCWRADHEVLMHDGEAGVH